MAFAAVTHLFTLGSALSFDEVEGVVLVGLELIELDSCIRPASTGKVF
jgi:hypothetical protein